MATDRLTVIEDKLEVLIKSIDKTIQPNGYEFNTATGNVQVDDEVIGGIISSSKGSHLTIDYTFEQDTAGEQNDDWNSGANDSQNSTKYILVARVISNPASKLPKRDVKIKCNEVLSDIKYAIAHNYTLDGNLLYLEYVSSSRVYNTSQNITRAANLEIIVNLQYGQEFNNPNIAACN